MVEGIVKIKVIDCESGEFTYFISGKQGTTWRDWLTNQAYNPDGKTELDYLGTKLVFEAYRRIDAAGKSWYALYQPGVGTAAEEVLKVHIPNHAVFGQLLIAAKSAVMVALEQDVSKRVFEAKNYEGVSKIPRPSLYDLEKHFFQYATALRSDPPEYHFTDEDQILLTDALVTYIESIKRYPGELSEASKVELESAKQLWRILNVVWLYASDSYDPDSTSDED